MPVTHEIVPLRTAKQWSKRLKNALETHFTALNVPLMLAQNFVAQQMGFPHWHAYEQQPQPTPEASAPAAEARVQVLRDSLRLTIPVAELKRHDFILAVEPFEEPTATTPDSVREALAWRPPQDPSPKPLEKGDWIMEKDTQHPQLGRVKACYFDHTAKEWVVDLVLYGPNGNRIGRESPRGDGPSGFEPAVPIAYWERIEKPAFPMTRDHTGYRDWRDSATVLPFHHAP